MQARSCANSSRAWLQHVGNLEANSALTLVYLTGATGIAHQRYKYTGDLLALEAVGGPAPQSTPVVGFMQLERWERFLAVHPDQSYAAFLHRGFTYGFRVGFDRSRSLSPAQSNLLSVSLNPLAVSSYLSEEVARGRLKVVSTLHPLREVHTSPIGIIPKANQPGKFRLIVDLSSPQGGSVNDGISPDLCSLSYSSVSRAAAMVRACGKGAKLDLKSAYRMVPVHSADQHLLGLEWQGTTYIDQALGKERGTVV